MKVQPDINRAIFVKISHGEVGDLRLIRNHQRIRDVSFSIKGQLAKK